MIKIVLIFLSSLFLLSYDEFISDGNNSDYLRLDHIVNTSENKIYLAIGVEDEPPTMFDLVKIDALGPNVLITKIRDLTAGFHISKLLALKGDDNKYNGEFVLAGALGNGRLEHFSYSADTYTAESNQTYPLVGTIFDIVQRKDGGDLYFVSNKEDLVHRKFKVTDNPIDFEVPKTIYEGYLNFDLSAIKQQSYLAEIKKDNVSDILREFSYNLDGTNDVNSNQATADTFFTLGFHTAGEDVDIEDLTIIGSTPIDNKGSVLRALSVNTSKILTVEPLLTFPVLTPPDYTDIIGVAAGTAVTPGSTAIYGPRFNDTNLEQILEPAFKKLYDEGNITSHSMVRAGNISKLTQGYYNVTFGPPHDKVINWLDLNCEKQDPIEKYLIPWTEKNIQDLTGTLTNQRGKTDYELCRTNDKFIYKVKDDNRSRIRRQWQFIYPDDTPLLWEKDIPNNTISGNPVSGRIETITTDNTSIAMISPNVTIGGINLFRIIDSTPGRMLAKRIEWHKVYRAATDFGDNKSQAKMNGPNLLKTIANDFLITGEARDLTRTDSKKFDCMVIKFDKNGNELWTRNLGGFHDDDCYSVVLEKNNTSPFYNDYIAVGNSGTRNPDDPTDRTSYAVKFRDEGTLIHVADGWSLISNGTDRNITAQGKKEESNTMGVTSLGAYKSYFQFTKNQWLINQYPIEPLDGFWMYTIDGRHDVFLEGNLIEQTFGTPDLGWVLLGTGVKLIKAKQKFNLQALWKFKEQRWIENPIVINPGEGFWAKKKR